MPSCRRACQRTCWRSSVGAGIDAATVVAIGALFGPAQVAARICELVFARRTHPLNVARFAVGMLLVAFALLALFGLTVASAASFANHVRNGEWSSHHLAWRRAAHAVRAGRLWTSHGPHRGTVPGDAGDRPAGLAFVAERASDPAVLAVVAVFATVAFVAFAAIRPPKQRARARSAKAESGFASERAPLLKVSALSGRLTCVHLA